MTTPKGAHGFSPLLLQLSPPQSRATERPTSDRRLSHDKPSPQSSAVTDSLSSDPTPGAAIERLAAIMARLRDPETGCPWDVEQDFATIAPYTIEEAHEVADAISRGDMADLQGELG